ncbi:MAG: MltA domain-containing protein [Hyphomicrobiales bacterium]|jgi:membrane-bound lytic murein transglycosylase A
MVVGLVLALTNSPIATPAMADSFPAHLTPLAYDDIEGWVDDDHAAALTAFRRTCERATERTPRARSSGVDGAALATVCASLPDSSASEARAFFETYFTPHRVEAQGLLTGYFEPQVSASFERTGAFQYPLYARPTDLVELGSSPESLGIDDDVTWGRSTDSGFEAFPDRAAIMNGALDGQNLELVYLQDPVDVFFIHIQGSARLAMTDGSVQRINFAGKSGHHYTPIGRTLVERGELALEDVTMDSLRAWLLAANPEDRDAVLATNRSFIFFAMAEDSGPSAGPIAAAGVPLTPGRSLAVDRHLHTFGTPVFVQSPNPLPGDAEPLSRLMIAQDTGSAIVGPARGDIFIGSGDEAGRIAGAVNQPVRYTILIPNGGDGS